VGWVTGAWAGNDACIDHVDRVTWRCWNVVVYTRRLRRAATWISTAMVAIVVALAVPVSQLRTISIIKACCCPDPDDCHCPDHKSDQSPQPTMRACHNTERAVVAPQLPAFQAPVIAQAPVPALVAVALDRSIPAPHQAPPPPRPDAPS
jgi:hypothetical protein